MGTCIDDATAICIFGRFNMPPEALHGLMSTVQSDGMVAQIWLPMGLSNYL